MERTIWTDLAASLSLGAALVHAAAAGTHAGDSTLVTLFAATALVQAAIGVALLRTPTRAWLVGGAVANLAFVAAWVASRTLGIPVIDSLAEVEAPGLQDAAAAALAAASALVGLVALRPTRAAVAPRLVWLPVLALVPALVGVTAPHAHGEGHTHGDEEAAHVHGDGETSADHEHALSDEAVALAADPVLAGADTTHATAPQLETAIDLVESVRTEVDPAMTVDEAEAAGYVWIGDGRRPGGYQHYINHTYMADGVDLDPTRIESLVFQSSGSAPELVSTMFVLQPGSTMDDVPDVAGDLTVWHDHQNLCWDATGTRLAGISTDGKTCRPAGELRPTPPMLHVWVTANPCGPFAGIEGHGADGCATHSH